MNPACISERGGGQRKGQSLYTKNYMYKKGNPKSKQDYQSIRGGGGQYNPACILEREGEKEKSEVEMGVRLEF